MSLWRPGEPRESSLVPRVPPPSADSCHSPRPCEEVWPILFRRRLRRARLPAGRLTSRCRVRGVVGRNKCVASAKLAAISRWLVLPSTRDGIDTVGCAVTMPSDAVSQRRTPTGGSHSTWSSCANTARRTATSSKSMHRRSVFAAMTASPRDFATRGLLGGSHH
jgi:hypothetical protein